ncbi:MAG TPA: DUF2267 domain-containing protein [Kofleriaceae bacterium]|nr:DUF2267 domain-containing protein [Kofleriaceae bacterium]
MSDPHVFAVAVASAQRWLDDLIRLLSLATDDQRGALQALRAGLHAIRDRLPAEEVIDLGAQLPLVIRGLYYEGWTGRPDPARVHHRDELVAKVAEHLGPAPHVTAREALRGVIALLLRHVSPGEIGDLVATFPGPIASWWREIAEQAAAPAEPPPAADARTIRHTGYRR